MFVMVLSVVFFLLCRVSVVYLLFSDSSWNISSRVPRMSSQRGLEVDVDALTALYGAPRKPAEGAPGIPAAEDAAACSVVFAPRDLQRFTEALATAVRPAPLKAGEQIRKTLFQWRREVQYTAL